MKNLNFFAEPKRNDYKATANRNFKKTNSRIKTLCAAICAMIFCSIISCGFFGYAGGEFSGKALAYAESSTSSQSASKTSAAKAQTTFVNAAILVSFSGETLFPENFSRTINDMYNGSGVSVKSYFKAQTNSCVDVHTLVAGGGKIYKTKDSVNAYKPRYGNWQSELSAYEEINPDGYDNRYYDKDGNVVPKTAENAVPCGERLLLEQKFLREVIELAREDLTAELYSSQYGTKLQSLTIITDASGTKNEFGELLWSHESVCLSYNAIFGNDANGAAGSGGYYSDYYFSESLMREYKDALPDVYVGIGKISSYNVFSSGELTARKTGNYVSGLEGEDKNLYDIGLLSHELMHSLGIGEYYPAITDENGERAEPVGEFDVMASPQVIPQYSLSYVREKAGWLNYDDFKYLNKSGIYTLYPVNDSNGEPSAGKIILSDYSSREEYFMVEVRSNSGRSGNEVFDSCLSGSGLIVYRVNESAAFTDKNGNIGSRDYCNAYADELYVFRKSNEQNKLNSPLGTFSFALLGTENGQSGNASSAHAAEDYSRFGVKKSQNDDGQTDDKIYYSDGTNSGIVLENITKNADGSVTFKITLPDSDGEMPTLNDSSVKIITYYDGSTRLLWNMNAKSGYAYILALRSTNRLKRKAENGSETVVSAEDVKSGNFSGYKTLFYKKVPLAEKKVTLPEFSDDALIFIAAETDKASCTRYVGAMERDDLSVKQYIFKALDPVYIALAGAGLLAITVIVIILIIKNRPRKIYQKASGDKASNKKQKKG